MECGGVSPRKLDADLLYTGVNNILKQFGINRAEYHDTCYIEEIVIEI